MLVGNVNNCIPVINAITGFLLKLMLKGGEYMMAMLWAQQIMLGKKEFADVPRLLKDQVKEILVDSGMEDLTK